MRNELLLAAASAALLLAACSGPPSPTAATPPAPARTYAAVDEPLRDEWTGPGIGLVILDQELETPGATRHDDRARVELVEREPCAVQIVLPVMRLRSRER